MCDQISDAVLDNILAQDPHARVACETATTTGMVLVMGEITTTAKVDIPSIVRRTVDRIGYNDPAYGFDANSCTVLTTLDKQSPDIAMGVDNSFEYKESNGDDADLIGAGDQGMMFGYACNETDEYMPAPIALAHHLTLAMARERKSGALPWMRPDGKSQVTVEYDENGNVSWCPTIVISTQHNPEIAHADIYAAMMEHVIRPVIPAEMLTADTRYLINPTGRFVIGGPAGDSGLTGRKIIVDTYGGYAPHGGGAFSGKDPTKVDRSAAYAARHIAKNIVAAGLAKRCEIQLAYAIGVARPVSLFIDTMGTGVVSDDQLAAAVDKLFDLRPNAIIQRLNLRRPIYRANCNYGHFGKADMPWEQLDYVNALRREILE